MKNYQMKLKRLKQNQNRYQTLFQMRTSTKIIIALLVLNTIIHTAEIIIDLQQAGYIEWIKS